MGYIKHKKYKFKHIAVYLAHKKKYPRGWHIHHINQKKNDNRFRNLIALPKTVHYFIHRQLRIGKRIKTKKQINKILKHYLLRKKLKFFK